MQVDIKQVRGLSASLAGKKGLNGFPNRTDSVIQIVAGVFSIAPVVTSYSIWSGGVEFVKTGTDQVDLSAAADKTLYFIYFDSSGNIQSSTSPFVFTTDSVPIANVFKDGTDYALGDERHGADRDREWHAWAHNTIGARYQSGLTGTFADTTLSVTQGVIADEDIENDTGGIKTNCSHWYRSGASMQFDPGETVPYDDTVGDGTGTPRYDAAGVLTNVPLNRYFNSYVYATNDPNYPVYVVLGQQVHVTLGAAQSESFPAIQLDTAEWKLLYRVTFQNSGGTGSYVAATDFRFQSSGPAVDAGSLDHAALTGRDVANQHPASAISVDTTNFDKAFTSADSDVQKLAEIADEKIRRVILPSEDLVAILNAATGDEEFILAEGTHTLASQVTLSNLSNVAIRGSRASVIDITYTGDSPFMLIAPLTDITFRGFTIRFNPSSGSHDCFDLEGTGGALHNKLSWIDVHYENSNTGGGANHCIRNRSSDADIADILVHGCRFTGSTMSCAVRFDVAAGRTVRDGRIIANHYERDTVGGSVAWGVYSFAAGAVAEGLVFQGNTIRHAHEIFGCYTDQTVRNFIIDGNVFIDCGDSGTDEGITMSGATGFVVTNNTIRNFTGAVGIAVGGSQHKITNNRIIGCTNDGIRVEGDENTVGMNTVTGCGGDGIQLSGDDNEIVCNHCRDNVAYGLNESAITDGNNLFGNLLANNTAGNENLNGSSTNRTRLERIGTSYQADGLPHSQLDSIGADDHHSQAHTVVSHSDTTATGAELDTLTDGSEAYGLHHHAKQATTLTPTGTTQGIDFNSGDSVTVDLGSATGDVTLTLSNPITGRSYLIKFIQGVTFRDVVLPSAVKLPGETAPSTLNITEVDDAVDVLVLYYDGTNYLANFTQNYG